MASPLPPLRKYLPLALGRAFRDKVEAALRTLEHLERLGPVVVSTSWGKDSVVLADLAARVWGEEVQLLHIGHAHALPGDEPVRAAATGKVHEIPARSLEESIEWLRHPEIGLPHERTASRMQSIISTRKKDRAVLWATERGVAVMALGMRAEENQRTRGVCFRSRGPVYRRGDVWIANPLAWWTAKDVWAYIASRNLVYNRQVYDAETHGFTRETIRSTGWLYTDGAPTRGWAAWLKFHFADQFRQLCTHFPEMESYA